MFVREEPVLPLDVVVARSVDLCVRETVPDRNLSDHKRVGIEPEELQRLDDLRLAGKYLGEVAVPSHAERSRANRFVDRRVERIQLRERAARIGEARDERLGQQELMERPAGRRRDHDRRLGLRLALFLGSLRRIGKRLRRHPRGRGDHEQESASRGPH